MKKELLKELESEIKATKKYCKLAIKRAVEGKKGLAIEFFDIAKMAKKCADEKVRNITKGNLNEEEMKIFCELETIKQDILKAYECIIN